MPVTLKQRIKDRKFQRLLADEMQYERNGRPVPGDVAELMTKPREHDVLYQVHVDVKGKRSSLPVGPKIGMDAAEMILETVAAQICLGKLPTWGNARLEACNTLRS